ncbi:MAG: hypothetical protein OEY01_16720 [Desulfobulbaceae bacterium]|nr:hypothetical protein [Desulfobulbaceae bacterium]
MNVEQMGKYASYEEVIFYRKSWVWGLLLLVMTPLAVLIGLTGDLYMQKDGQFTTMSRAVRLTVSIGFGVVLLIRIFGPMFV